MGEGRTMKINNVMIVNWQPPGDRFWEDAESKPDEPLLEAAMSMTLSWNEYQKIMAMADSSKEAVAS